MIFLVVWVPLALALALLEELSGWSQPWFLREWC